MDGDINYSKYSAEDLNEALARIDRQRFPLNYANLLKEAAARPVIQPQESRELRRPALVKAIVIFYGAALSLTMLAFVLILLVPAAREKIYQAPSGTLAMSAIGAALNAAATIQLFRMKRSSFYFYCAAFALTTVQAAASLMAGMPLGSVLGGYFFVGYIPLLLTSIYTWRLTRQNVLT